MAERVPAGGVRAPRSTRAAARCIRFDSAPLGLDSAPLGWTRARLGSAEAGAATSGVTRAATPPRRVGPAPPPALRRLGHRCDEPARSLRDYPGIEAGRGGAGGGGVVSRDCAGRDPASVLVYPKRLLKILTVPVSVWRRQRQLPVPAQRPG